ARASRRLCTFACRVRRRRPGGTAACAGAAAVGRSGVTEIDSDIHPSSRPSPARRDRIAHSYKAAKSFVNPLQVLPSRYRYIVNQIFADQRAFADGYAFVTFWPIATLTTTGCTRTYGTVSMPTAALT